MTEEELRLIVSKFHIQGTVETIKPIGNGLINETFCVTTAGDDCPDYVLQRINNTVFTDVDLLQRNIELVTNHIRHKLQARHEQDIDRKCLRFIHTSNGLTYHRDARNRYWRMSLFIPNAVTKEEVNNDSAFCCGQTFGNFEQMLVDLQEPLGETIPNFHNMELRLGQLRDAVKADKTGRVSLVRDMLDTLTCDADEMCLAEQLHRRGALPKRICHCDTKVNNMMFDNDGSVLCVIDLDTVMPSFVFSDYGDFLRTGANRVAEDSDQFESVGLNEDIFCAFTEGYLASSAHFLTPVEVNHLPYAVALFPYMQCVRFLTDYINGDVYYKIRYPEHNFVRSRNQLLLYQDIRRHDKMMAEFVQGIIKQ